MSDDGLMKHQTFVAEFDDEGVYFYRVDLEMISNFSSF
jgi:hypothetical protein